MKKTLLSAFILLIAFAGYGQKNAILKQKHMLTPYDGVNKTAVIGEKSTNLLNTAIGTTWYDLQNGNNLGQRIYEYDDGTIGAIWLSGSAGSPPGGASPDRGTAYSYWDGSSWSTAIDHLGEDSKNGSPTYAPWGENGEIIMHYYFPSTATKNPMKFMRREVKGEGEWIETELYGPDEHSLVWGSMITSGENNEYIHVLAYTYTYDDPVGANPGYLGQDNALLYYRSSDGAQTWEIEHELIDGLGVDDYLTASSLTYTWAQPVGENLAFVYGPSEFDGKIFKSDDNGDSWDDILFYESPFQEGSLTETEMFGCGDGNCAIALDSEGTAHVVFSKMLYGYNATGGLLFTPTTEGIIYWTEGMAVLDSTQVSSYTNEFLEEAGQLIGYMLPDPITGSYEYLYPGVDEFTNYNCGITSFPQMGIDANDNMFVTYHALAPGFESIVNNYRHIHLVSSWDGGANWNEPVDLMADNILFSISECAYPAINPIIEDKIHIVFQEDFVPGIYEWLAEQPEPSENTMKHLEFDKDFFVGVESHQQIVQELEVSSCYPNPAVGTTQLNIRLDNNTAASVIISNMMGQTVNVMDLGVLNQGNNTVHVQLADVASGIYYLTVKTGNQKNTQKLIVK